MLLMPLLLLLLDFACDFKWNRPQARGSQLGATAQWGHANSNRLQC
jgi:hypothetical protein